MLKIESLFVPYAASQVLHEVSLSVQSGETPRRSVRTVRASPH